MSDAHTLVDLGPTTAPPRSPCEAFRGQQARLMRASMISARGKSRINKRPSITIYRNLADLREIVFREAIF